MNKYQELMVGYALSIAAIVYIDRANEIETKKEDTKPLNNIEAILITEDHIKRISNPGIKIKNNDRSDSKKILNQNYRKNNHTNPLYHRRIMPTKFRPSYNEWCLESSK